MSVHSLGHGSALVTFLVIASISFAPARAIETGDLCTGNPCVIGEDVTIDESATLDFGDGITLVIAARITLSNAASVTFQAGSVTVEPGASFRADGPGTFLVVAANVGNLTVGDATKGVRFKMRDVVEINLVGEVDAFVNAKVDVRGVTDEAGAFSVEALDGTATILGKILGDGDKIDGFNASQLYFSAPTVILDAKIKARGRGGDSGFVEVAADDAVIRGSIDLTPRPGVGGELRIDATNDVTLEAKVKTRGKQDPESIGNFCDGGLVEIDAGGTVTVRNKIDARGGGEQCPGGTVDISSGGDYIDQQKASIRTGNSGALGLGGDIAISAGSVATVFKLEATGDQAGTISVSADTITVLGRLRADSKGIEDLLDGTITLDAPCGLTVAPTAKIDARNPKSVDGQVTLRTSGGPMTLSGRIEASDRVDLEYVTGFAPVINATILPDPNLVEAPSGTCGS